jgi:hypothetical protein
MANAEELRKKRNKELLERMDDPNDPLTNGVSKQDILFPIRLVIKKDKKEIDRVLNEERKQK